MKIKRFKPGPTAKTVAWIYGIMSLAIFAPMVIIGSAVNSRAFEPFMLLLPVLYFGLTYIFTALFCVLYNWVAQKTGGIEIETT